MDRVEEGSLSVIDDQSELGRMVKVAREYLGLTQEELAKVIGTNRTAVAHLEQGLRLPEPGVLGRILAVLQIPPFIADRCPVGLRQQAVAVRCHCLTYYTKWKNADAEAKRRDRLVYAVKNDEEWRDGSKKVKDPYSGCADRLKKKYPALLPNRVFVPVPRSQASSEVPDEAWASLRLAEALASVTVESRVKQILKRRESIRTSSAVGPGRRRPTVREQVRTLDLDLPKGSEVPLGLVLVDDVVTLGTTLCACASLLAKAGWRGRIDALVVAYTCQPEEKGADGWELSFGWSDGRDYPNQLSADAQDGTEV